MGLKILVADDDAVVRRYLDRLLSKEGHDVILAEDGDMAWKIIQSNPEIDAFLLDWTMPGRDGVELCHAVRAVNRGRYPYIILVTSRGDKSDVRAGMASGADDFMTKPVDRELLEARLAVAQRITAASTNEAAPNQANNELEHLEKLKSAFIRLISHEVRSPLVVLDGMLRLLERELPPDAAALQELVQAACNSSERLSDLLCRTLKLSEKGEFADALQRCEVNLTEEISKTLGDLRTFSDRRNQALTFADDTPPCVALVDSDKIIDAVINLVMNAIKFTPDGGAIHVDLDFDADGIRLSVADSGAGIHPEDQDHVWDSYFSTFDMLHHSSGAYEFQKRGIGLGLAIVKQFISLHGGTVGFNNRPGEGTTFYFVLPEKCVACFSG